MNKFNLDALDYVVKKLPLQTECGIPTNEYGLFNDQFHLGTVKSNYTLVQNNYMADIIYEAAIRINADINLDAVRARVSPTGNISIIQLPLPNVVMKANAFGGGDTIKRHLTVINSFDGKSAIAFGTLNTVLSCANQFRYMYKRLNTKFRHSSSIKNNILSAMNMMVNVINEDIKLHEIFNQMRETTVTQDDINTIVFKTLDIDPGYLTNTYVNNKKLSARLENKILSVNTAMRHELSSKGNTMWGAFNGITYYYNHLEMKDAFDDTANKRMNIALDTAVELMAM